MSSEIVESTRGVLIPMPRTVKDVCMCVGMYENRNRGAGIFPSLPFLFPSRVPCLVEIVDA